jgi:hypothetical protein
LAKKCFSYFCYLIRIEHEKCPEMCVWIVRFGLKIEKMGLYLEKKTDIEKSAHMSLTSFILTFANQLGSVQKF